MKAVVRVAAQLLAVVATAFFLAVGLGPHTGAYRTLTVLTASMEPAVPAGAVVVVRPIAPADIRVGDVLTYNIPIGDRRVVTHRVVDIPEPGVAPTVVTKGDALEERDPWTPRFATGPVWKVAGVVPLLGYVLTTLQTALVQRLSVTVLPALFAVLWLLRIWAPVLRRDRTPAARGSVSVAPEARTQDRRVGERLPVVAGATGTVPGHFTAKGLRPVVADAGWSIPSHFTAKVPRHAVAA